MLVELNVRPVFKYIGGKVWLANELRKAVSGYNKKIYSEVFCGGLGAFTSVANVLALEGYEKIELNDINRNIVGVYSDIMNNTDELIERLGFYHQGYLDSISDFDQIRELSKDKDNKEAVRTLLSDAETYFKDIRAHYNVLKFENPNVETSALLIMIQMLGFNGIYRENRMGLYNVGFCWEAKDFIDLVVGRINEFNKLKDVFDIQFSSLDFRDFEYTNDKLIYTDPPYTELNETNSKMKYNMNSFCMDSQIELIELLNGKSFVYSNHYNDELIEKFKTLNNSVDILNVSRRNTISSKTSDRDKTVSEILVVAKEKTH